MTVDTKNLISITEANQNFSKVARLVDKNGFVIILKNNNPRYVVIDISLLEGEETANNEDVKTISKRLLNKNKEAYKILAK